jgi:hypothetical protein
MGRGSSNPLARFRRLMDSRRFPSLVRLLRPGRLEIHIETRIKFDINIKPRGMCGRCLEEQNRVCLGTVERARIQDPNALDHLVADFMRMAVQQNVDARVEEAFDFSFEMAVRHTDAQNAASRFGC